MGDLFKVHHFSKRKDSQERQLTATKPYLRIVAVESRAPIFLKGGRALYEDEVELKPIPEWLADTINKLSDVVREEIGFSKIDMKVYKKVEKKTSKKGKGVK